MVCLSKTHVTVIRWNPIREIAAMQRAMDRVFDDAWRNTGPAGSYVVPIDIHETDSEYKVVAALPGLHADDIHINIHDSVLSISGEFKKPAIGENVRVLLEERSYGKFTRNLTLSDKIDADGVEAAYENGILMLTLPKSPEAQPRQIQVKGVKELLGAG